MPVQSQYPVGPLGQPAPSDNAQISQPIEGAVDFDQVPIQSTESVMSPPTIPGYWNPQQRSGEGHPTGFNGEGYDFRQQHVLNEINGNRASYRPRELYMNHSNVNFINSNNNINKIDHNNIGFHVDKEDFPALNQALQKPPTVQLKAKPLTRAATPPPTPPPPSHPLQDNYDLESFVRLFQNPEFLRPYDELNFEDLLTRLTQINPLHKCAVKCSSVNPVPNMKIGVVLELGCSSISHPEDPRTEPIMASTVLNYRLPLMEHDAFFCTSDQFKRQFANLQYDNLGIDTLFFIYYTFINDVQQLIAANSLFNEGWRYNKKLKAWCRLSSHIEPVDSEVKAAMFHIFNPEHWFIDQQFVCFIEGDFEEFPPAIPPPQPFFQPGFCSNSNNEMINYQNVPLDS